MAKMAVAPTVKELSDVVKEANLAVKQHGVRACAVSHVAECRKKERTMVVSRIWIQYLTGSDWPKEWDDISQTRPCCEMPLVSSQVECSEKRHPIRA